MFSARSFNAIAPQRNVHPPARWPTSQRTLNDEPNLTLSCPLTEINEMVWHETGNNAKVRWLTRASRWFRLEVDVVRTGRLGHLIGFGLVPALPSVPSRRTMIGPCGQSRIINSRRSGSGRADHQSATFCSSVAATGPFVQRFVVGEWFQQRAQWIWHVGRFLSIFICFHFFFFHFIHCEARRDLLRSVPLESHYNCRAKFTETDWVRPQQTWQVDSIKVKNSNCNLVFKRQFGGNKSTR